MLRLLVHRKSKDADQGVCALGDWVPFPVLSPLLLNTNLPYAFYKRCDSRYGGASLPHYKAEAGAYVRAHVRRATRDSNVSRTMHLPSSDLKQVCNVVNEMTRALLRHHHFE